MKKKKETKFKDYNFNSRLLSLKRKCIIIIIHN